MVAYTYDAPGHDAPTAHTVPERGPPAPSFDYITTAASDRWSHGVSVRLDGPSPGSTAHAQFVHAASSTTKPGGRVHVAGGDLSSLLRTSVAAKTGDEVADIGHAGLRHQFPNTLEGKSQFYDDINLGDLASRTKDMDGFLQTNGNTRYVLRNPGGVGVDRATGLPTDVFTVIRGPDGWVVTMFPGIPKG